MNSHLNTYLFVLIEQANLDIRANSWGIEYCSSIFFFLIGAEKLLEIWFHKVDSTSSGSLRSVPHFELVNMLQIAKCHILHMKSNEYLDSYILRYVFFSFYLNLFVVVMEFEKKLQENSLNSILTFYIVKVVCLSRTIE